MFPRTIRFRLCGITQRDRLRFPFQIDFDVDIGGFEADMTEPGPNCIEIDSGLKQMAGTRMHIMSETR